MLALAVTLRDHVVRLLGSPPVPVLVGGSGKESFETLNISTASAITCTTAAERPPYG